MEREQYLVGSAKLAIPYPDDFFPYHSWGPRRLTGIHDDLCVRVIYLEQPGELLMVSIENGDIDPAWVERLSEYSGVAKHDILISATHTHTAPYIGGYWPEDVEDVEKSERYTALAWKTVEMAVSLAKQNVAPARLLFGIGYCDVNVNRDAQVLDTETNKLVYRIGKNLNGYSEKEVPVMRFVREDGTISAVLFNYGVHSSVLFGTHMQEDGQLASGDLAGCAMTNVEKSLGHDAVAMFTMAPAADQNPRYDAAYIKTDENGNKRTVDYGASSYVVVDLQGRQLANAVLTVCESNLGEQETEEVVTVAETIMVPGKEKKEGPGQKWPKSSAEYVPAEPVPLPLALTAIGTLVIVSIGCEVSSGNAARIREIMNENGFSNCVIVTQCNGSSSYMSDPHGYHVVTFSAKASHMMPEAVDFLMTGLEMLIQKL